MKSKQFKGYSFVFKNGYVVYVRTLGGYAVIVQLTQSLLTASRSSIKKCQAIRGSDRHGAGFCLRRQRQRKGPCFSRGPGFCQSCLRSARVRAFAYAVINAVPGPGFLHKPSNTVPWSRTFAYVVKCGATSLHFHLTFVFAYAV